MRHISCSRTTAHPFPGWHTYSKHAGVLVAILVHLSPDYWFHFGGSFNNTGKTNKTGNANNTRNTISAWETINDAWETNNNTWDPTNNSRNQTNDAWNFTNNVWDLRYAVTIFGTSDPRRLPLSRT